jgi:alkylation response protein AidB-like acyl-CoA dehydrogenase
LTRKFINKRNIEFLLYEVFDVLNLTKYPYYQEHNREMFDMVLDTSVKIAEDTFLPIFEEMDREPPEMSGGKVKVHPKVREIMHEFGEGGWIGSIYSEELGGFQLPIMVDNCCNFIFSAANYSAIVYPGLSKGAAGLIINFGSQELIDAYVPQLLSGEWQGTMALTEPQAGSSLTDITMQATPGENGIYRLRGRKIFISAADHDGVENVIHLMLAKIPGGPTGVKGISLFVVPQKRITADGRLEPNDVISSEIYHKLGYRGAPIVGLSLGENNDCHGYLVGEEYQGLRYMFQMMNEARLGVGMGAAAIASAAFYSSLDYTQERTQGRKLDQKDPTLPQVAIIEHADIKRMLLFQKAIVEGSLSLLLQCSYYADLIRVLPNGEEKERMELMLDILTPVAKSYPSEMGVQSVSQALQCLGGYGYCDDFPIEQYYRDMRIHPIHEGTTGIQGIDLLGRKVVYHQGKAYRYYLTEVKQVIAQAKKVDELHAYATKLDEALDLLQEVTADIMKVSQTDGAEHFLADATPYLEFFGLTTIGWQWLLQGLTAVNALKEIPSGKESDFYQSKLQTLRYFFKYELPKTLGIAAVLKNKDNLTAEMESKYLVV